MAHQYQTLGPGLTTLRLTDTDTAYPDWVMSINQNRLWKSPWDLQVIDVPGEVLNRTIACTVLRTFP